MSVTTADADEWDDVEYGDKLRYVGPSDIADGWATPRDYKQPYKFQHVSVGGVVTFLTQHNAKRHYVPEHPCHNRDYWEVVDA